jgi:hypothetical protein
MFSGARSNVRPSSFTHRQQIWDLFEGGRLFRAVKDGLLDDELHLAEMVSFVGSAPKEVLQQSDMCNEYWDCEGE